MFKDCHHCIEPTVASPGLCTARAYGREPCRVLAAVDPEEAIQNADNLEHYATDLGYLAKEEACPLGASTVRPDSDGECTCPPGMVCKDGNKKCPRSFGSNLFMGPKFAQTC